MRPLGDDFYVDGMLEDILYSNGTVYTFDDLALTHRCDPILVGVVRELGQVANGETARLTIIYLPDNFKATIMSVDGIESLVPVTV